MRIVERVLRTEKTSKEKVGDRGRQRERERERERGKKEGRDRGEEIMLEKERQWQSEVR